MTYSETELERWDQQLRRARALPLPDTLTPAERDVWPTADGLPSHDLSVAGETRIAVAGDWESQDRTVFPLLRRLKAAAPDIRTIVQLGDLQWRPPIAPAKRSRLQGQNFVQRLDQELQANDIDRVIVIPGNHDWWERLHTEFSAHPDRFLRAGQRIWLAPRGKRFQLANHSYLCMGGAASLERDGGPYETPTEADIDHAISGGSTDVLLTHEAVNAGIGAVEDAIRAPSTFTAHRRHRSRISRARVTRLWSALQPGLTFHGHMHVAGSAVRSDGRVVHSLNLVRQPRHVAILTLADLGVTWLDDL
ncbi:metallophosphoesterase family protein [Curtobacterium sp. Arg-1]|uniref:metallophosphoesterase family protein n=1 Tax=Curtobacterium sp. Arg-1 TaxID=2935040 RepID=UPI0021D99582|nr:metallophosphoesterase [Curtobacterium sp. Arg-1]UXZ56572.1 metallophosphoesterase [Curtobacterium sp. Arg-1]